MNNIKSQNPYDNENYPEFKGGQDDTIVQKRPRGRPKGSKCKLPFGDKKKLMEMKKRPKQPYKLPKNWYVGMKVIFRGCGYSREEVQKALPTGYGISHLGKIKDLSRPKGGKIPEHGKRIGGDRNNKLKNFSNYSGSHDNLIVNSDTDITASLDDDISGDGLRVADFSDIDLDDVKNFRGIGGIKDADTVQMISKEQAAYYAGEIIKCKHDPVYFANNYFYIVSYRGEEKIKLYPKQEEMLENFINYPFSINLAARQSGKCLSSSTMIKVRNKKTGEISEVEIGKFFNDHKES